ncbi:late control protein [Scandinavium sp. TWS1a]|uniref:phage late control D family protein n=1 Tax=Scandinavium tedordense TaxID=2926521 RepID=UPI0021653EB8|nr:contractile injection system protein, VgrG/Pvc8 family [Scandinavium tedordense]MCS2173072.1 late control protein [Scandinavium tedordense]
MSYIDTGSKPWLPNFAISVEGEDITDAVRENLIDLSLKDYGGDSKKSDQISFAVVSPDMKLPGKGVKISVSMGFGDELVDKGNFVVDSRSSGGSSSQPRVIEITARAFSKTNERGHSSLQSQKTRSFASGTLMSDLVSTIAAEHGLTARVDSTLEEQPLSHVDQLGESDMNLLTRIAAQYGAVSKVTHDYWVITPRGAQTTVSGKPLPVKTITPDMCSNWRYYDNSDHPDSSKSGKGTVVVSYRDMADSGRIKTLTVGSGEPVNHYPIPQKDIQGARVIAGGCSAHSTKKLVGMSLVLPATPEMMPMTAEAKITTSGFGSVEDREWKIASLDFRLSEQGFSLSMDLE